MHDQLSSLAERFWDTLLAAGPTTAALIGDHRFDTEIEDASSEAEDRLIDALDGFAAEAESMDPGALTTADRVTRGILLFEARSHAAELRSRMTELRVDPMMGVHIEFIQAIAQLRPTERSHADAYVQKASKVGHLFDQVIERHRQGVANGRTPPRVAVEKVLGQIDAYLASPLETDAFLQIPPPGDMGEAAVDAWRASMADQVASVVRPAFERYRAAVAAEVLPNARPPEKSGVCWLPDGDEMYSRAVARYTSLDVDADTVHQVGVEEIASLEEEYRALGETVLGTTDVADIYRRLRDDPALRFETADQVREAAEQSLARATEAIPRWFGRLPQAPCIVQPIPDVGAEDATIAYYYPPAGDGSRPGIYFINLSEPTTRTRYEAEALAFHESIPGHHLQLAIAQELDGIPDFQRFSLVTAYAEGWGLYTERLSDEMGLYSGDLARMGILSFDSWRACRLVVDTGLHAKGWSRQQAIDYMMENSPQAPNNIANEVDRYIGWPGQALAYKIGQREIFRLRAQARQRMGERFDIKSFHDVVLGSGAVPLGLLAELVEDWIGDQPTG
jgi:uncharacterized protein (DUF885 family)